MRIIYYVLLHFILINSSNAQIKEFNTADLRKTAKIVEFEFAKNLKNLSEAELFEIYNSLESDRNLIKQFNISSWAICEYRNIDNFDIYNYYYQNISRHIYNKYCKELNALMLLDGTIKQPK